MAAAREELAPAAVGAGRGAGERPRARAEAADAVEARAVELALQIAEKVVAGDDRGASPSAWSDVVRGALRCLVERERVTCR